MLKQNLSGFLTALQSSFWWRRMPVFGWSECGGPWTSRQWGVICKDWIERCESYRSPATWQTLTSCQSLALCPSQRFFSHLYDTKQIDTKKKCSFWLITSLFLILRCQNRKRNSCMTRRFLCQVLPLNLDRKLARKAKMAKVGCNASYGFGNEY